MKKNNILSIPTKETNSKDSRPSLPSSHNTYHNSNGGEPPMDKNKYVTHDELKISNLELKAEINKQFEELKQDINKNFADINVNFEKVNTKFEQQKVWFYGTSIAIVTATCTIVGFLLKFIH